MRIIANQILRAQIVADPLERLIQSTVAHIVALAARLLCQGDQRVFPTQFATRAAAIGTSITE